MRGLMDRSEERKKGWSDRESSGRNRVVRYSVSEMV